jgi:hypothetical protein
LFTCFLTPRPSQLLSHTSHGHISRKRVYR